MQFGKKLSTSLFKKAVFGFIKLTVMLLMFYVIKKMYSIKWHGVNPLVLIYRV